MVMAAGQGVRLVWCWISKKHWVQVPCDCPFVAPGEGEKSPVSVFHVHARELAPAARAPIKRYPTIIKSQQ